MRGWSGRWTSPARTANGRSSSRESRRQSATRPRPGRQTARAGGDRRRRARRRQGSGREAERLTNKRAYEEFGAHKVYGRIPAGNDEAKKAVIYNGWKQEGVMRNHVRHGEELIDVEVWGFPEDQPAPPDD